MKTQKMSLTNIQKKLSRAEMKNIMAGSGGGGYSGPCGPSCSAQGPTCQCYSNDSGYSSFYACHCT
jgi:hypothetical protein